MQAKEKNCMMQRCSCMHEVSIKASEGSGIQGLDPNQNSQPLIS